MDREHFVLVLLQCYRWIENTLFQSCSYNVKVATCCIYTVLISHRHAKSVSVIPNEGHCSVATCLQQEQCIYCSPLKLYGRSRVVFISELCGALYRLIYCGQLVIGAVAVYDI